MIYITSESGLYLIGQCNQPANINIDFPKTSLYNIILIHVQSSVLPVNKNASKYAKNYAKDDIILLKSTADVLQK